MHTLEPILAKHPFFKDLETPYLKLIVGCASNVVFREGQMICRRGEDADRFYLIRHGRVAVELHAVGRGTITVQTLGEGDILGWSWLIPPYQWDFDARAVELTRAIAMDGTCLRTKSDADHNLGYELLTRFVRVLVGQLEATRIQLLDLYRAPD
jgi:CRP-like cAMP-binding protein